MLQPCPGQKVRVPTYGEVQGIVLRPYPHVPGAWYIKITKGGRDYQEGQDIAFMARDLELIERVPKNDFERGLFSYLERELNV